MQMYSYLTSWFGFLITGLSLPLSAQFVDQSIPAGINNAGQNRGVSLVDYDGDGWEDIYFTRLDGPNVLYHNNGDGTFTDRAETAGLAYTGPSGTAVWGDLDNDGWLDLVLGNRQEASRIYRNLGNGTFTDITIGSGVQNTARVMSVNLADVDQDGWLDIYFANLGAQNALYRNNGNGTFSDYTYASGALDDGIAMGAIFFDYDRDGDPDLYLTHDAYQPNILYQNTGQGIFVDVSRAAGVDLAAQGMGVDVADIDQDGWLDIYITNLYENTLFRNLGDGRFEDISSRAGITDRGMGWGITFFDYDQDSWPDIYVANETSFPVDYQYYDNILYRNLGGLSFGSVTDDAAIKSPFGGYGVAAADLDHNGQLDLVIANSGQAGNQLLLNWQNNEHHWVGIELEGSQSNRSAIGARVVLEAGDLVLTDEVIAGSGFSGQNSLKLHFGLGSTDRIDRLQIFWPSGQVETYEGLLTDQNWHFVENAGLTAVTKHDPKKGIDLKISPNPVSGPFNLQLNLPTFVEQCRLILYNAYGQLIVRAYDQALPPGISTINLQLGADDPAGIYYLEIIVDGWSRTEKLIFTGQ